MIKWYVAVLKKYAEFNGRASRSEYWYFTLFSIIISIALSVIGLTIKFPLLSNIYSIAVLLPSIAVGIRRMHDIDKSGWYLLIPFYNIYLLCIEGTVGVNQYGPDASGLDEIDQIGSN
jgi:uncharacterized membrane protein YhaH (DUF805 family)